jgi:tRNA threonylcarbamoyladenosine biosynthesis protein TsaB
MVLCIETATYQGSLALAQGQEVLGAIDLPHNDKHIKNIAHFSDELMRSLDAKPGQLAAIALSAGPGSYTGLRIGASFAKGLAFGLGIPLIALDTLRVLAQGIWAAHGQGVWAVPLVDARRMEVYVAVYDPAGAAIWQAQALVLEKDGFDQFRGLPLVMAGTGCTKTAHFYRDIADNHWVYDTSLALQAAHMARLAALAYRQKAFVNLHAFEPSYLKEFMLGTPKDKKLGAI